MSDAEAAQADLMCVCAIGASAGGLAPVEEFFDAMPGNIGAAFVVVQHLSPDHESMMVSLLSNHTEMPVEQAVHGSIVEPDHVYLISPGTVLSVRDGRMQVGDRDPESRDVPKPIDNFFSSMAGEFGERAVAIVLSGTGSDGTNGIEAVRRAGGVTLVQDSTAAFEGMPTAAHQSGFVDAVLDPTALAGVVSRFATTGQRPGTRETLKLLNSEEERILTYLTMSNDIDFREYKPATISRRLHRRMMISGHGDMDSYADMVRDNEIERMELIDDLFIDVTQFFRDPDAFTLLAAEVIPELIEQAVAQDRPFRMWVPGCATGEEAYSLTMLAMEAADKLTGDRPLIQTFATDVHQAALEKAGLGQYPVDRMAGVSDQRRERFFDQIGGEFTVKNEVRSALTFARHNLLTDAPFTRVDLVSCRNLLIYFRTAAQERAISSMGFALRHGGALFLGPSETLGFAAADYAPISPTWRLWRKESDHIERNYRRNPPMRTDISVTPRASVGTADLSVLRAYDAILTDQFAAGLLINQRREVVYVMGGATSWLGYASGRPTSDVLSLIGDAGLRLIIGASLRELESGESEATARPLGVNFTGPDGEPVALLGKRVQLGPNRYNYLLYTAPGVPTVTFPDAPIQISTVEGSDHEHVVALEVELRHTRESLQASLEEQETSNEELNAANEELIASNEELQSTNEELSSVNEELRTLNDEHQRRLDQMLELSADLEQLMSSTDIAVVFLAEDATVRRFNEPARDYFRIRDNDVGRPFTDVVTTLSYGEIHDDVQAAFATGAGSSRTVRNTTDSDQRLMAQVSRYELPRNRSGVLIAVVNITEIQVADEERMLASALRDMPAWFSIWDAEDTWVYANRQVSDSDIPAHELVGQSLRDVYDLESAENREAENRQVFETGEPQYGLKTVQGVELVAWTFRTEIDGLPHVTAMGIPASDIAGLPEMERALLVADSLDHVTTLAIIGPDGNKIWSNGHMREHLPESWSADEGLAPFGLDQAAHKVAFQRASAGENREVFGRLKTDEGFERFAFRYFPARSQGTNNPYPAGSVVVRLLSVEFVSREMDEQRVRIAELEADLMSLRASTDADVAMLAERNEDLDNFAHVAAHDLKAPIRSIRSFSEMALEDIPESSAARDKVEQVIDSSKRMASLVESLLDFAAIGRGEFETDQIDLTRLVDDITIDLRSSIVEREADVVVDLDAQYMYGSSDGIRQVLANLVQNALKFSGDRRPHIEIRSVADRDGIRVDIDDNGIGFPSEEAARLFEPFQRLHATTEPGSGVGLAICRRIVQRHGGKIWASNHPEGGATFSFWLPAPSADVGD